MTVPNPNNLPRGLRNNNPGNIRHNPRFAWKGLSNPPQDDAGYAVFEARIWGLRAMARDLRSKQARGLNTIRSIIEVYAPRNENHTTAYINTVAQQTGWHADESLNLSSDANLLNLMRAMIRVEIGSQYMDYMPDHVIMDGIQAERR